MDVIYLWCYNVDSLGKETGLMWKKRFVAAVLTAAMVLPTGFVGVTTDTQAATKGKEIELAKSASNPIAGQFTICRNICAILPKTWSIGKQRDPL